MEGDSFSIHKLRQIVWAADDLLVGVVTRLCDDSIIEFEINESSLIEKLECIVIVYFKIILGCLLLVVGVSCVSMATRIQELLFLKMLREKFSLTKMVNSFN